MLTGAEAAYSSSELATLLIRNLDMAARFAGDATARFLAEERRAPTNLGSYLAQAMAVDAEEGNAVAAREGWRRLQAWFQRRDDDAAQWEFSAGDRAAVLRSNIFIAGPEAAAGRFLEMKSRGHRLAILEHAATHLLCTGKIELFESFARNFTGIQAVHGLVAVAMTGRAIDLDRLEAALAATLASKVAHEVLPRHLHAYVAEETEIIIDSILGACEMLARHGRTAVVADVLALLLDPASRDVASIDTHATVQIDALLRACCLQAVLLGQEPSIDALLGLPLDEAKDEDQRRLDQLSRARDFMRYWLPFYRARAHSLAQGRTKAQIRKGIKAALKEIERERWRFKSDYNTLVLQSLAARGLSVLLATRLDPDAVLAYALPMTQGRPGISHDNIAALLRRFCRVGALHPKLIAKIGAEVEETQAQRIGAFDKSNQLLAHARLLTLVSPDDGRAVFNKAIDAAREIDLAVLPQLEAIAALLARGLPESPADRRGLAIELGAVIGDAALRLGDRGFPWQPALSALARLDWIVALSCTARWDDTGLKDLQTTLPPILAAALADGAVGAVQAAGLLTLIDPGMPLVLDLCAKAAPKDSARLEEEFSRDLLLGRIPADPEAIEAFVSRCACDGDFGRRLKERHRLEKRPGVADAPPLRKRKRGSSSGHAWIAEELTRDDLLDVRVKAIASETGAPVRDILGSARACVPHASRLAHLDALARSRLGDAGIVAVLVEAVEAWRGEGYAVSSWAGENLPRIILQRLPGIQHHLRDDSWLPRLLEQSGAGEAATVDLLLTAIERHADGVSPDAVFALAGIIAGKLPPGEAGDLAARLIGRLAGRIGPADRDMPPAEDIPATADAAVARLLFASMSDIDHRQRWRAAHAARRLARLGEGGALAALVRLGDCKTEGAFRGQGAHYPFYWLAARLWLLIALDRIASECPALVADHWLWLLRTALDDTELPHVLMRAFARDACLKLLDAGVGGADPSKRQMLLAVNAGRAWKPGRRHPFRSEAEPKTRFRFDATDTIRYWYEGVVRGFSNVAMPRFLREADRWIVDRWGVPGRAGWETQSRGERFNNRSFRSHSNSHGALPRLERYETYLEWHAMWCAAGSLLATHAVNPSGDRWDSLEREIRRWMLTEPPQWLSDLAGPPPLEERHRRAPDMPIGTWKHAAGDDDVLAGLLPQDHPGYLTVEAEYQAGALSFRERFSISTALVSPETAAALVKTFQSMPSRDYHVPDNPSVDIDEPGYRYYGWIDIAHHDPGIDRHDPFRQDVGRIEAKPGRHFLEVSQDPPEFLYEAWGASLDEDAPPSYNRAAVSSSGYRLLVRAAAVERMLKAQSADMIAKVRIERSDAEIDASWETQKAATVELHRPLLLRRDGSVETAAGCLGSWQKPGPRARPRRAR